MNASLLNTGRIFAQTKKNYVRYKLKNCTDPQPPHLTSWARDFVSSEPFDQSHDGSDDGQSLEQLVQRAWFFANRLARHQQQHAKFAWGVRRVARRQQDVGPRWDRGTGTLMREDLG